jgi:hypothetical protein
LRNKPRDNDNEPSCCFLQLKKNAENDNKLRGSLSSFATKEKIIKDDDKLGSQLVVIFFDWRKTIKDDDELES